MRQLYGRRWITEHGERISENLAWRKALESMTPDEAALGWKACRDSGDEHPCTLPMFLGRVSAALRAAKPTKVYKALPESKERRTERMERASEHVERLREKLR